VRRRCFEEAGLLDESLGYFEDRDMWLRISDTYEFRFCSEPLYEARIDSGSSVRMSENPDKKLRSLDSYFQKHADRVRLLTKSARRRLLSKYSGERAMFFCKSNMLKEGREELVKSILWYPLNVRSWRLLLTTVFGLGVFRLIGTSWRSLISHS